MAAKEKRPQFYEFTLRRSLSLIKILIKNRVKTIEIHNVGFFHVIESDCQKDLSGGIC